MVELGDKSLFRIESGGTPSSSKPEYWNGDIKWITLIDLPQENFITDISDTKRKITELGLNNSSAKLLPIKTVLVSSRATIGRIAISKTELATNQGFKNVIIKDFNRVNERYLACMLMRLVPQMEQMATGGTYKEISRASISTLRIPLPPLEVQEKIVAELDGYQKIIDGAKEVVENYKPTIKIDPDWPLMELGKVAVVTSSKRIFQDEYVSSGIPFYRTKEIVELSQDKPISLELYISKEKYDSIKEQFDVPKQGDILISAVGTIGISWVVSDNREFYFKDGNLLWIKNIKGLLPKFLKCVFDYSFSSHLNEYVFGAAYKALTIVKLKQMKIFLPPLETQEKIVAEIESERELVEANKKLIEIFEKKIKDKIGEVWGE